MRQKRKLDLNKKTIIYLKNSSSGIQTGGTGGAKTNSTLPNSCVSCGCVSLVETCNPGKFLQFTFQK
jgi:hypothetical protein